MAKRREKPIEGKWVATGERIRKACEKSGLKAARRAPQFSKR